MGVVNRTDEFRHILRDFATKSGGGLNFETPQATSQLNRWSSEISAEIHETLQKVGELRKLSKQTRLFNAKTDQIQELIYTVTQKIQLLNPKIEALESQVKSSRKNKSYQTHASTLVETLKTRFFQLNKEFKDAQEDWTKALLQQEQRRQDLMYSSAPRHVDPVPRWQRPRPTGDSEDLEVGGARAVAMQHGYRSSRVEAILGVQKNISELAQIVQRIAVTVTAQEETVRRIDAELDDAVVNLQLGQANLLQYFRAISSNRALIVKVFLILIFFVIFFVVFLA